MSSNWPTVKTGDVFDLINGFAFKSKEFCGQGASVLKIKNVKAGYFALDNLAYVDPAYLSKKSDKVVQKNDLLITMSGNRHDGSMETWVGKVAWFNEDSPYLINQRVGILRLKDGLDINPRYMAYQLSSVEFQKHFIAVATSSGGQANLSPDQIKQTELNCPPREIQDEIVNQLGCLEDKAKINSETNQTLEQIAQALFKSWFVDFDPVKAKISVLEAGGTTEEAELAAMGMIAAKSPEKLAELKQLKPDAYEQLARTAALFPSAMQESELGPIPENWTCVPVIKSATFINGAAYKNMHFSDASDAKPVIKIAELKNGISDNTKYTNTELGDKFKLDTGDILFSWSGSPETSIDTFIWTGGEAWLNQHIFKVVNDNAQERCFTYWLLKHLKPTFIEIAKNKQTTGLGHVTRKDLERMFFCKPSKYLSTAFFDLAGSILGRIESNLMEGRILSETRDQQIPELLSGRFMEA